MKIYKYRFLLWQLIAAMDAGKHNSLSCDEVKRHARDETIRAFLEERFPNFDFSLMQPNDWDALTERFASMENAIDTQRKFGVRNSGIALLMAYTLQCLQEDS